VRRLLAVVTAATACGGGRAEPPTPVATAKAPQARIVSRATRYRYAGLLWNRAVSLLPVGARSPVSGDPGRGFLLGVVEDEATWRAFVAAAELRDLPAVDFARELVVFTVLDARTSALSPPTWRLDDSGRAVFSFAVGGAEPENPDAAPAALAVVERAGVRTIAFRTLAGQELGRLAVRGYSAGSSPKR
jgi:hypothetical protein